MPLFDTVCDKCGEKKEVLTLRFSEELPKCGCGGNLHTLPSRCTFRWAYREGVWEEENGKQTYKGKGGPQRIIGGERLRVHDNMPEMAEEKLTDTPDLENAKIDQELAAFETTKNRSHFIKD